MTRARRAGAVPLPSAFALGFLAGGGEMGALIRAHDWAATPLGPPETWPPGLRMCVRLMLSTNQPMSVRWGQQLIQLFNDAYGRFLDPEFSDGYTRFHDPERQRAILGRPVEETWPEAWSILGPEMAHVLAGNGSIWRENVLIPVVRNGARRDAWWTYGYSPIDDPASPNGVGGVLAICTDVTAQMVARREQAVLLELGDRLRDEYEPRRVLTVAVETLSAALSAARVSCIDMTGAASVSIDACCATGLAPLLGLHSRTLLGDTHIAALAEGRIVSLPDLDAMAPDARQCRPGARASLAAPLLRGGVLSTVVLIDHDAPRDWQERECRLLRAVTERTGVALDRARALAAQREGEEEARRMSDLLEAIGASSPDLIYAKDREGRILYANPATLAVLGRPAAEVLGKSAVDIADDPAVGQAQLERDLRIIATACTDITDEIHTEPDGTMRVRQSTRAPLRDATGAIIGLVGVTTDITNRRIAERDHAFLLSLHDRMRWDPSEALPAATALLAEHLRASRVGYCEIDPVARTFRIISEHTDGEPNLPKHRYTERLDELIEELAAGQTVIVGDADADRRVREGLPYLAELGGHAILGVPLRRNGALRGAFYVVNGAPRAWTTAEVRLVEEVATRAASVADQARAEAAFDRASDEFRTLADNISQLAWMSEPDGSVFWVNRRWLDYTGASVEQMRGPNAIRVQRPDYAARVARRFRAAIAARTPWEDTFPIRGRDGQYRWFLTRAQPIRDADGQIVRWLGTNTDVTEQREAEERLAESERRLALFIERAPAAIAMFDADMRYLAISRRYLSDYGLDVGGLLTPSDLIGRRQEDVFPSLPNRWRPHHAQVMAGQTMHADEDRFERPDGRTEWVRWELAPWRRADGEVGGTLLFSEVITARMEAETALRRLNQELAFRVHEAVTAAEAAQARAAQAERMQALGQLAGGIAHDLNNVLQAVQGGTTLIDRRANDPASVRRLAEMVLESASRGASITSRLLAFARRGDLRAEAVDPGPLLLSMREILSHSFGPEMALHVAVAEGLPPMLADKGQLETVLVNLATNARDAMLAGGNVTLSAEEVVVTNGGPDAPSTLSPGRYIRLRISDDGEGMDSATLARAAEPFFTTKPLGKGTGLGLSMARGFAEQSGGALAVESRRGEGTVVTLWLPLAIVEVPAEGPHAAATFAASSRGGAMARILLVDDEALVLQTLEEQLSDKGYAVTAAAGAAEALRLLDQAGPFDMLITDLTMPGGMDGLALIREARQRAPGLPAILLTGYAGDGTGTTLAVDGATSGAFSLLRKPISDAQLSERVSALLAPRSGEPVKASPSES